MKAHIGVDSETGIVHSLSTTAANAHDVTEAHNLLHSGERVVWCDAGYQGVHKRWENLGLEIDWQVAMRPGKRRKLDPVCDEALTEKLKASVRAKVEHPFQKVKRVFGYAKVRYRGLAKNTERLALLFGLGNLLTAESRLTCWTRAQCAQILPMGRRWACKVRYEAPLGRNEEPGHPENGPGAENTPETPPVTTRKTQTILIQIIPSSAGLLPRPSMLPKFYPLIPVPAKTNSPLSLCSSTGSSGAAYTSFLAMTPRQPLTLRWSVRS